MKTVKIDIEQSVKDLLKEVSGNVKGYDVYLGGGFLRDSYCNLHYKDIDIFLVPNGEDKQLVPYQPKDYGISYTKTCDDNNDMKKRGVGALIGLYEKGDEFLDKKEVQYIIYDKHMTQEDLCLDMDMTINQVMWNPCESECMVSELFISDHDQGWLRFQHKYDNIRMYCRLKRMEEKFPYYDVWDEIELTEYEKIELAEKGEYEYEGSA